MKNKEKRVHPTQKPLKVMRDLIEMCTDPTDLVADPFMGSGSTLVAAKQLGRPYCGCDFNPNYVGLTNQRLSEV